MATKKLQGTKFQINQKYYRTFSESFKRKKVKEISSKCLTVQEVSDLYEVSRTAIYKWIHQYSKQEKGVKIVIEMESEALKTKQLKKRLAELERIVGQKQLLIDLLEKTIDLASQEVGYDLKKKYEPNSLNASEPDTRRSATE